MWQREGIGMELAGGSPQHPARGRKSHAVGGARCRGGEVPSDRFGEEKNKVWALAAKATSGGLAGSDGAGALRGGGCAPRRAPARPGGKTNATQGKKTKPVNFSPPATPAPHSPGG